MFCVLDFFDFYQLKMPNLEDVVNLKWFVVLAPAACPSSNGDFSPTTLKLTHSKTSKN